TDLPMLMDFFAIGRNTELMSGHKNAMERAEKYRLQIEALIPPAARCFDGGAWSEMGIALKTAKLWSLRVPPSEYSWREPEGDLQIAIDDKVFETGFGI